jgi:hypothetical protein
MAFRLRASAELVGLSFTLADHWRCSPGYEMKPMAHDSAPSMSSLHSFGANALSRPPSFSTCLKSTGRQCGTGSSKCDVDVCFVPELASALRCGCWSLVRRHLHRHGATLPSYQARRHPVSSLALGSRGWIQKTNFLVAPCLYGGFTVGLWRSGTCSSHSRLAPALLAAGAVGLIRGRSLHHCSGERLCTRHP